MASGKQNIPVTQELLQSLFLLNKDTGLINASTRSTNARMGERAGSTKKDLRRYIRIGSKLYLEHRLIWMYLYGKFPVFIDHIDGNPSNNALYNLREATKSENNRNVSKRCTNTSGYKGVTWHHPMKKWRAQMTYQGTTRPLGFEAEAQDAAQMYNLYSLEKFGEFAKLNGLPDSEAYFIWE